MIFDTPISFRERFLRACRCQPVDRPPLWMMRQAGRSLPEYRVLKQGRSFTELVQNPTLAAEISLQPIHRFGYDAAIVFSDILVVAKSLGASYELMEGGGVKVDHDATVSPSKLDTSRILEEGAYTFEALRILRKELAQERALIGFSGAPWTLATFMLEGGSHQTPTHTLRSIKENPAHLQSLLEKITQATILYLQAQIEAGADVIQIFDSQGGSLPTPYYEDFSAKWIRKTIKALPSSVPIILFARGVHHDWNLLAKTGASVLSVDFESSLSEVTKQIPNQIALQGNLNPTLLCGEPKPAVQATRAILSSMKNRPGFIFNLGHGVPPDARIETIQAVAKTVQTARDF